MNPTAIAFIKAHEGCALTAYQDQGGVWTCGWGATGSDIRAGTVWTQEQADDRLDDDAAGAELDVLTLLPGIKLSDQSLAALTSFVFNLGKGALALSHLLTCVKTADYTGAAQEFQRWCHVGQTVVKGLLIRRLEEAALFLKGT